jgi:hypothetical protein
MLGHGGVIFLKPARNVARDARRHAPQPASAPRFASVQSTLDGVGEIGVVLTQVIECRSGEVGGLRSLVETVPLGKRIVDRL